MIISILVLIDVQTRPFARHGSISAEAFSAFIRLLLITLDKYRQLWKLSAILIDDTVIINN